MSTGECAMVLLHSPGLHALRRPAGPRGPVGPVQGRGLSGRQGVGGRRLGGVGVPRHRPPPLDAQVSADCGGPAPVGRSAGHYNGPAIALVSRLRALATHPAGEARRRGRHIPACRCRVRCDLPHSFPMVPGPAHGRLHEVARRAGVRPRTSGVPPSAGRVSRSGCGGWGRGSSPALS